MRVQALLLALLAAALLQAVSAQTKVALLTGSALGAMPISPTPNLSAPALQFFVLSPSMIANAPAAEIVPFSPSAVKPAASALVKPGYDEARNAGVALFDGAGKLAASSVGDGPFVSGARSDGNRSSGLSPPTEDEITAAYRAARPKSDAIETFGRDFVATAGQEVKMYTFMGKYYLPMKNPIDERPMDVRERALVKAAEDLVDAHDARADLPSRRFMQLLGRWYAFRDREREYPGGGATHLPPSPIANGEYWDMAAGMNAQHFIHRELHPDTRYSFFDNSPFVVSYLKTAAELAGAKNAAVVEGDINTLARPAKPLAVLRTKNAVHYVPGFDKKLEEMADWVAPGGQLVIQNDPNTSQRGLILEKHGPLIRRLLAEGWKLEYGFSGRPGKFSDYRLDTLIMIRPELARERSRKETAHAWEAYANAASKP